MSADKKSLYVAAHDGTALDIINLDTMVLTDKVNLPAKPRRDRCRERRASTDLDHWQGTGDLQNVLLVWDPSATNTQSLMSVPLTPPPPQSPVLPAPSGRQFLTNRSQLSATDGRQLHHRRKHPEQYDASSFRV